MKIKAQQKFIRISPRKLRLVAGSIKHLEPKASLTQLKFMRKKAATHLGKTINQAIANATNNKLNPDQLKFDQILIDEGPTYKRWLAVSRGRAHSIFKRSSHITVILDEKKLASQTQLTAKKTKSKPKTKKGTTS